MAGGGRYVLEPDAADQVCRHHGEAFMERLIKRYSLRIICYMQVGGVGWAPST